MTSKPLQIRRQQLQDDLRVSTEQLKQDEEQQQQQQLHFSSCFTLSPSSPGQLFHLPSPIITRRTRTYSASERALRNPVVTGKVKYFCRNKGHGYITPDGGGDDLFVHVSDVDGEFVPREGDEVTYRLSPIPPKNERSQAVHVQILNMAPGTHEKWDIPAS